MMTNSKEVKIKTLTEFKGNKDKVIKFIREVELYFHINKHIYDTGEKKITFLLSFMTDGAAAAWKEAYIADKTMITGGFAFRSQGDFLKIFKEGFAPIDEAGNAHLKLKTLKQGEQTAKDYISDFCIYASKLGITADEALSEYFIDGLQPRLLEKIFTIEKLSVKIADWFIAALKYDSQWHCARAIIGKIHKELPIPTYDQSTSPTPFMKEPDAMNVDGLNKEQRLDYIKKGPCFKCHLPGHIVNAHKKTRNYKFKKPNRKGTYDKIRAVITKLNNKNKEALKLMEEQDF